MAQAVSKAEPLPEAALQLVAEIAEETGETTAIGAPASDRPPLSGPVGMLVEGLL